MASNMFRLLLALTLILNGFWAPWAMARMTHGEPGSTQDHGLSAAASDRDAINTIGDATRVLKHECGSRAVPSESALSDSQTCCDGISCQCGCAAPPAVSGILAYLPSMATHLPARSLILADLVPLHNTPPLRPPAA